MEKFNIPMGYLSSEDSAGEVFDELFKEDSQEKTETQKKGIIPKGVLAQESVSELINQLREEPAQNAAPQQEKSEAKKTVIPKGVLAQDEVEDYSEFLFGGGELTINDDGTIQSANEDSSEKKAKIPNGILASQWYETNHELYNAEVEAMRMEFNNPNMEPKFMEDGRMYWLLDAKIKLTPQSQAHVYKIALVYASDHPKKEYGTSIHSFLVKPNLTELESRLPLIFKMNPAFENEEVPTFLPHTIQDSKEGRYLCTVHYNDVSDKLSDGTPSAVTSYRLTLKWLLSMEVGIRSPKAWRQFHKHGAS